MSDEAPKVKPPIKCSECGKTTAVAQTNHGRVTRCQSITCHVNEVDSEGRKLN